MNRIKLSSLSIYFFAKLTISLLSCSAFLLFSLLQHSLVTIQLGGA